MASECSHWQVTEEAPPKTPRGGGGSTADPAADRYDIHDADAFNLQPIRKLRFNLYADTVADLTVAENAVWDLNNLKTPVDREVIADAMRTIEAMASVRMDGKQPDASEVFFEIAASSFGSEEQSTQVERFLRDRASLGTALELASREWDVAIFREVHAKVLPPNREGAGGKLRKEMKPLGGSRYHVFGSAYSMPSPDAIEPLLEDITQFLSVENIPVIEQAGIAHAQLVNIHPFERGNGKMARMIINTVLSYRGITSRYLLPITPVISTSNHDYIAGINACKLDGSEPKEAVDKAMNAWLAYFSSCCLRAADISVKFIRECEAALAKARESCGMRKGSAGQAIISVLPALPVFSAQMAAQRTGASYRRVVDACNALVKTGVLSCRNESKRNRVFYSPEVLDAYLHIDALR